MSLGYYLIFLRYIVNISLKDFKLEESKKDASIRTFFICFSRLKLGFDVWLRLVCLF